MSPPLAKGTGHIPVATGTPMNRKLHTGNSTVLWSPNDMTEVPELHSTDSCIVLWHHNNMTVVLEHNTGMSGVPKLHSTDKCTVLHHPTNMNGVPEQKTYSHTKHCTGYTLYIFSSCLDDGFELILNM